MNTGIALIKAAQDRKKAEEAERIARHNHQLQLSVDRFRPIAEIWDSVKFNNTIR